MLFPTRHTSLHALSFLRVYPTYRRAEDLTRFRRRLNQREVIRGRSRSPPNAAALEVGTYVCVRGTVSAGSRKLNSPLKGIPCVAYRLTTVRVVDSRSARRKARVHPRDLALVVFQLPFIVLGQVLARSTSQLNLPNTHKILLLQ